MAQADKAVAYLELNSQQFTDALAAAQKALVAFAAGFSAYKIADFFKEGIDGAIKFGNEAYFAAQKLNGFDPGNLLLVQKSLEAAGDSASEARAQIQEFGQANRPLDRLFKGGSSGYTDALQRAAKEYGTQASVLTRSAEEFSFVQQQLTNLGTKLQGFFLGLADEIAKPLSALLAQIDQLDLVSMGEKFGGYVVTAINTIRGLIENHSLFTVAGLALKVGFEEAANYLIGAANSAVRLLTKGDFWAGLATTLIGVLAVVGSYLTSLFLGLGKVMVATIQAGIAQIAKDHPELSHFVGGSKYVLPQHFKDEAYERWGKKIAPDKIAKMQGMVDAFNQAHPAYSTDIAENLRTNDNNSAVQSLNAILAEQLEMSKEVAKGGISQIAGLKVDFTKSNYYDTSKDSKALADAIAKALQFGGGLGFPQGKQNPIFTERADSVHVIADSLAKVGGGGRYVRTGLSIAEKAAMDTAKYTRISADALTRMEKQQKKTTWGGGAGGFGMPSG